MWLLVASDVVIAWSKNGEIYDILSHFTNSRIKYSALINISIDVKYQIVLYSYF